jgi:predicted DsbA family dithiol-disulfide isomerase
MSKKSAAEARAERAAAALAEQRRRERRRTFLSITGVVVAMVLIVAGGFLISRNRGGGPTSAASDPGSGTVSTTIGKAGAPHSVVIWEDFLCPFCGELEKQTRTELATAADQGKVQVTYRPFNLLQTGYSQQTLEVFAATQHSAGDAVAKKLHDLFYEQQPSERGPFPSEDDIVALAVQAGADRATVQKSLDDGDAKRWADESTQDASDAGVQSTPTVLLDGHEVTGRTVDDLAASLLQSVGS